MDFNFSGMMRGIGAGAVNVGQMLKEQAKLDWETQQANLKYEREQHMLQLQQKYQSAEAQKGRELTETEAEKTRAAGKEQWQATDARQKEQNENTQAFQTGSLAVQNKQADNTAANQAATLGLQREQLNADIAYKSRAAGAAETEAKAKSAYYTAEGAKSTAEATAAELKLDMNKEQFNSYKVLADQIKDPIKKAEFWLLTDKVSDKSSNRPPGDVVTQAMASGEARVDELKGDFKDAKVKMGYGGMSDAEAKARMSTDFTKHSLESLGYSVGGGSSVEKAAGGSTGVMRGNESNATTPQAKADKLFVDMYRQQKDPKQRANLLTGNTHRQEIIKAATGETLESLRGSKF